MAKAPSRLRRWLPRFSLRTLLLLVMLIGSAMTLSRHWRPWYIAALLPCGEAAYSPDGNKTALFSDSNQICDAHTGRVLCAFPAHTGAQIFEFSPDSKSLLIGYFVDYRLGLIDVVDVDSGVAKAKTLDVSSQFFSRKTGFSYDGKQILDRFHLRLFDIENKKEMLCVGLNTENIWGAYPNPTPEEDAKLTAASTLKEFEEPAKPFLTRSTVSADRRIAATNISGLTKTQIWNLTDGKKICEVPAMDWEFRLSPDGRFLATHSEEKFSIWDARKGTLVSTLPAPFTKDGNGQYDAELAFSKDGGLFVCANWDDGIRLWDTHSGKLKFTAPAKISRTSYLAFFPDGMRMACNEYLHNGDTAENAIHLRDTVTGELLAILKADPEDDNGTEIFSISPDGNQILAEYNFIEHYSMALWRNRRPEYWWGVAWLPEFWMTVVFASGFVWSVWRDRRMA